MTALATKASETQYQPTVRRAARPHLVRNSPSRPPRTPRVGLTQAEVAAYLGVSQQTVAETEQRALRKCREWCRRHGVDLSDLLPEEHWQSDTYQDEKRLHM